MTTPHPSAKLLRAIADGKQMIRMTEKQYPELPTHFMLVQESFRDEVYLYTARSAQGESNG